MPTITVESVSDIKTDQRGVSSKIKAGNDSYYINEDGTPLVGKSVEIEVTEKTSQKGNKYKIGKIVKVLEGKAAGSNGHISWDDYRAMAEAAHELAKKLEPDSQRVEPDGEAGAPIAVLVDRSTARAAILNTVMIAFSNGKIANPMADDDTIPF